MKRRCFSEIRTQRHRDENSFGGFTHAPASSALPPPPEIADALAADVKRIFTAPETQKALNDIGAVPSPMTPDEFAKFIASERKKWEKVVKEAGVSVQ
jgi:tripartite-type tricarboxylate transporter receptor subunit TctC